MTSPGFLYSLDFSSKVSTIASHSPMSPPIFALLLPFSNLSTSNFAASVFTFCFFAVLLFLLANPLEILHFCKMSCGFIMGRQGGNTTTHFAACVWTDCQEHGDQSQTDFERSDAMGHFTVRNLWSEKQAVKFVLYTTTVIIHGNGSWNHFVGGWYYLIKSW